MGTERDMSEYYVQQILFYDSSKMEGLLTVLSVLVFACVTNDHEPAGLAPFRGFIIYHLHGGTFIRVVVVVCTLCLWILFESCRFS